MCFCDPVFGENTVAFPDFRAFAGEECLFSYGNGYGERTAALF